MRVVTGLSLPRVEALLDPRRRADDGDLVGEVVGHGHDRLVALAGEEEVLDLQRLFLEAHPLHQLGVVVLALGAHTADVEAEHALHRQQSGGDVVGHRHVRHRVDLESGLRVLELVGVHVLAERRVVERQPAVGDLRGLGHVLGALGAEEDRDVGAQRVRHDLQGLAEPLAALTTVRQGVELAVVLQRALAAQGAPDDVDVLARARQWPVRRLPVPALDDLRPRHAEAEDEPPVGEVVERDRRHGRRGGGARRHLHDAGADLDGRRVGCDVRGVRERVVAPRFGDPHRVEAEALRFLCLLHEAGARPRPPVPEHDTQLHDRSPGDRPAGAYPPRRWSFR